MDTEAHITVKYLHQQWAPAPSVGIPAPADHKGNVHFQVEMEFFQHYLWWTWGLGGFTLGSLYHNLWSEFNWDDCCAGRVSTCLASVPNHPVQLYLTRSTTAGGTLDLLAMTKPTMCQGDLTLNQISRGSKAAVCLYCTIWGLSSLTVKTLLNSKSYFYCFQL